MSRKLAIVMAAGKGKRMHSARPKVLHPVCGLPMVCHALRSLRSSGIERICVVTGHGEEEVRATVGEERFEVEWATQRERRGTADAVKAAMGLLGDARKVLVANGDTPLVRPETFVRLMEMVSEAVPVTFLSQEVVDPTGYGRVVRRNGRVEAIVEERESRGDQRGITEINAGIYAFDREFLEASIPRVKADNAAGEYYITDLVRIAIEADVRVEALASVGQEGMGVNTRADLALAGKLMRRRILDAHMTAGASIVDPDTTYVEVDVEIGADAVVGPFTVIRRGARIASGSEVGPFSHVRAG